MKGASGGRKSVFLLLITRIKWEGGNEPEHRKGPWLAPGVALRCAKWRVASALSAARKTLFKVAHLNYACNLREKGKRGNLNCVLVESTSLPASVMALLGSRHSRY